MTALALVSLYLFLLAVAAATAKGARSPVAMTEHGSAVLVWLEKNPRPGTPRTRRVVEARSKARVWRGLRAAGVYWPFMCLHSHEGAWNSNTGNGYWGGLQMDEGFMGTYGAEFIWRDPARRKHLLWGTADRWPVVLQMVAAYRAYHGYHGYGARGFSPWGTRGMCGL